MNILITGAGRGIGLGFVVHYLSRDHTIYACYRSKSAELSALAEKYDQLELVQWDVTRPASENILASFPKQLDLLINNAGIYGPIKDGQSLQKITAEAMHEVFDVNCVAPLRVVQTLLPRLMPGAIVANISSKMGSSSDNTSGGTYAYRAAKAALIIVSKSMAVDLQSDGINVITLHPGWVRTDMTNGTGLVDVDESVDGMTSVIENINDYEPGDLVAYDGSRVPF